MLNQGFSHCKHRKPRSLFFHASIKNLTNFSHHTICSCSVSRTLRFSTWSLIVLKKKYLIFLAFSFREGVVEPVWFFSPPRKRTVKKQSFRCQQEGLFYSIDQWPFTYRYHVDRFLKVKDLFTKTCLPRIFGTNKRILFLFDLIKHVPIYHIAIERKGKRQGRPLE